MQASLFDDSTATRATRERLQRSDLTKKQKFSLLALNSIPLLHLATVAIAVCFLPVNWLARALLGGIALYLAPPFIAYLVRTRSPIRHGRIPVGSKAFFSWWALFQLQIIFCRLPVFEELLRLVPGAYSAWLRLWGARIGRLTFWSPGVAITDRSYLSIGNDVVLGAGVRINPHVLVNSPPNGLDLLLETVSIGDGARVGGYSLLAAGSEVGSGEVTDALLILPPGSAFKDGKRIRAKEKE
jgi:hypothetical protein